ncbi:MAG: PQQ-binding-like beta-propeller repeat protein [Gammaproteobacteria bacterium]|nr:PQQ-binding-like beta-propeller repeat protein [Gammaproteobacteria bacterium]
MKQKFVFMKLNLIAASLLASQVYAAVPFSPENQPLGTIGPVELSNTNIENGAKAYRGWFENGGWQGDLIEYDVSNTGALTTSIDLSSTSPKQGGAATNWSAHVVFAAKVADSATYWDTDRKIITNKDGEVTNASGNLGTQVAFRWQKLSDAQKQLVDAPAFGTSATSSDVVDFLRGERVNEYPEGSLRLRFSILGDIVHSNPEYVGAPEGGFPDSSYASFANSNATRAPRVYVGANDGMLHAFNATNGNEVWAYVPSMVIKNLSKLVSRPYTHSYFVDGGITVQDAEFSGSWHSVLLGSLGAGAKGLFALDVTSPAMSSEAISTGSNKKVLWELDSSDNDIGYIFDATTLAKLNDGKWYAVFGNGVSSVNGIAKLVLVEMSTGAVTKLSTSSGSAGSPNGLSAPALVDLDNDGDADVAYAGDVDGDMWKFDLSGAGPGSWSVAYKLYDGSTSQVITMAPDVTNHPRGGSLVLFGTGRLYTAADVTDKSVQALYGIWDKGAASAGTRLAQLLSADTPYSDGTYSETVRTFTTTAALDWNTHTGWKVDLPAGERLLTPPQIRAGRLKSTITDPDGYENWLLEVTFDEGGVADNTIFDLNRSGVLDTADRVDNNGDGDLDDPEDIPMGWKTETGNMSQVTIARLSQGFDTLFLNFLNPPTVPEVSETPCNPCDIAGGHIDVDTDSAENDGLANATVGHVHEYDDNHNLTYVDYFDVNQNGGGTGELENFDHAKTDNNQTVKGDEKFLVFIANADFSPAGVLTIAGKSWNVVDYQIMMHDALFKWDGVNDANLKDDEGRSLVFTIDQMRAAGVADGNGLSIGFNVDGILRGGIHPTQVRCVSSSSAVTNDRWRNGVLTMHVVKRSHFVKRSDKPPMDMVTVQKPDDLPAVMYVDGEPKTLIEDINGDGDIKTSADDYEARGGIHVSNNEEFLYEGTIFWHFGDLAEAILGERPCYGETLWSLAVGIELKNLTEEDYKELLKDASFKNVAELQDRIDELDSCKNKTKKKGGCKEEYEQMVALLEVGEKLYGDDSGGDDPPPPGGGSGSIDGSPVIVSGGVAEGGVTSGPNFEVGRRTWIDILPE